MAGVEMACAASGIRVPLGAGVAACQRFLMESHVAAAQTAAR